MTEKRQEPDAEDGRMKKLWRGWSNFWGFMMALVLILSVLGFAHYAVTGQTLDPTPDQRIVVVGEGSYEGEDLVSNVSHSSYDIQVNFSSTPSKMGISEAYLYNKKTGERVDRQSLSPLQKSVELGYIDDLSADYRVLLVDGSNEAKYDGVVFVREVTVIQ